MYVYFAVEDKLFGKVKIGYTSGTPQDRIVSLQTGNPTKIICYMKVIGNLKREVWFHDLFYKERHFSEWFKNKGILALFLKHSWCFGGVPTLMLSPEEARNEIKHIFINYKQPSAINLSSKNKYNINIHNWFSKDKLVKKNFVERWLSKLVCKYLYFI